MTRTDIRIRQHELAAVMPHFPVGQVLFSRPAGGTANASVVVTTRTGQYVLKRRNSRYCDPTQLVYDHHVLAAVRTAGLPAPQVVKTISGSRWLEDDAGIYELYRFIEGKMQTRPSVAQVAQAGSVLARFHTATADLQPPGRKDFGRLWDPKKAVKLLEPLLRRALAGQVGSLRDVSPSEAAGCMQYLLDTAGCIERILPDSAYWALPQTIIHADWHPANLKYQGDEVVGIFDFDWVDRQPRMVDGADGLLYFGGLRPQVEGADDIWSLTATPVLDEQRMKAFMAAYAAVHCPTDSELAALPGLLAARWIYSRVDAADRKVAEMDQLGFVLRDVEAPLRWLERQAVALADRRWWQ